MHPTLSNEIDCICVSVQIGLYAQSSRIDQSEKMYAGYHVNKDEELRAYIMVFF